MRKMLIMIRTKIVNIIILVIFLIGNQSCWLYGPPDDGRDLHEYYSFIFDQYYKYVGDNVESDTIFLERYTGIEPRYWVESNGYPIFNGYFRPNDTISFSMVNDTAYVYYTDTININVYDVSVHWGGVNWGDVDSLYSKGYKKLVFYTHWKEWLEWR